MILACYTKVACISTACMKHRLMYARRVRPCCCLRLIPACYTKGKVAFPTACAHCVSTFGKCRRGVIRHMQDGGVKSFCCAAFRPSLCVSAESCQPYLFYSSSVCLFLADRCELIASVTAYHNMLELLDIHQCYTARPRSESCNKRQRTEPIAEHVQSTACSRLLSRYAGHHFSCIMGRYCRMAVLICGGLIVWGGWKRLMASHSKDLPGKQTLEGKLCRSQKTVRRLQMHPWCQGCTPPPPAPWCMTPLTAKKMSLSYHPLLLSWPGKSCEVHVVA